MCYAIDVAKFWKASVAFPVGEVLPLLRRSAQERGFQAYVRHLALDNFPEIAAQLPLARALKLAGPRLQSKNLWIGDGTNSRTHSIQ